MTVTALPATPRNHVVNFYDHDADIVAEVAQYAADGLAHGERVVIVATPAHRAALDEVLIQHGIDPVRARFTGRYLPLDAAEMLGKFMVGGVPEPATFTAEIGAIIDAAAEGGCPVRVFGEMVALLWDGGNVAGAVALEALWNELARSRPFALLCGYPASVLATSALRQSHHVCALHSGVLPPRSYAADRWVRGQAPTTEQGSDVFVPVPAAVPAARRFVTGVLKSWGEDDRIPDAALVTSELSTNAVSHAVSPFRVTVSRAGDLLRIAIEDVAPTQPRVQPVRTDAFGGRGMSIVEQLSERWGCDPAPDGKVVWAELARTA